MCTQASINFQTDNTSVVINDLTLLDICFAREPECFAAQVLGDSPAGSIDEITLISAIKRKISNITCIKLSWTRLES